MNVCAICTDEMTSDMMAGRCGHVFHQECLLQWCKVVKQRDPRLNFSCPVCKKKTHEKPIALFMSCAHSHSTTRGSAHHTSQSNIAMRTKVMFLENVISDMKDHLKESETIQNTLLRDIKLKKDEIERLVLYNKKNIDKINTAEKRAEKFKLDLISKTRECSKLYEKVESFAASEYAETNDLSSLEQLIRRSCGVDGVNNTQDENKYLRALVRQQHKSVCIAKDLTDKYFQKLTVAKRKVKKLRGYISTGQPGVADVDRNRVPSRERLLLQAKAKKRKKKKKIKDDIQTPAVLKEVETSNLSNSKKRKVKSSKKSQYSFASTGAKKKKKVSPFLGTHSESNIKSGYDLVGGLHKVFKSRDNKYVVSSGASSSVVTKKTSRIKVGVVKNHASKKSLKRAIPGGAPTIENFFTRP